MAVGEFTHELRTLFSTKDSWSVLSDVHRLANWVDIVGEVEVLEELGRYTAVLEDQVGPFKLRADLDVVVTELAEGERIAFRAEGEDRQVGSRLSIEASMQLEELDRGSAVLFQGRYSVEGRVATMGGGLIKHKADRVLEQFVEQAENALS